MLGQPVTSTETHSNNLYPSYRVFIFGQEVTADVVSIALEDTDGSYPGTCAITLLSKNDRYIVTPWDMRNLGLIGDLGAASVAQNVSVLDPTGAAMNPTDGSSPIYGALVPIDDDIKRRVILAKRNAAVIQFRPPKSPSVPNPKLQSALRYPFHSGKPIFHPNDPVRVFVRDPVDPNVWYYQFVGLASDFTEVVDSSNNNSVTIVAETPAKWLRYGRFTANPSITDIRTLVVQDAIVQDVRARTVFANLFAHLSLPEIFFAMLFGVAAFGNTDTVAKIIGDQKQRLDAGPAPSTNPDFSSAINERVETIPEKVYSVESPRGATLPRRKWGIGHLDLNRSTVFEYGQTTGPNSGRAGIPKAMGFQRITTLADYQAAIDHTVASGDLKTMRRDGINASPAEFSDPESEPSIYDVITYIGTHPEIYPVDGGRLMMLIPRSFGAARREVVTNDIINSFTLTTEWTTRGEILAAVMQRIQFIFYVSPRGDFCVEFPLYDFMPEHFDHPTDASKQFGRRFLIGVSDTQQVDSTFSDSKVYTQATCAPVAVYGYDKSITGNDTILRESGNFQVVTLWHLIPLYGVRPLPLTPHGLIGTQDGANMFAHIALNKLNCESYTQKVVMNPRFTAWLNRPYYVQRRNHMGTTRSIAQQITWGTGGDATTTLGLGAMRGWDGTTDDHGKMIFTPIGGAAGRPLSFDVLYKKPTTITPNQGNKPPVKAEER